MYTSKCPGSINHEVPSFVFMFRIDHIDIFQIFQGILYKYRLFVVLSKNCKRRTKYKGNGNALTIINTIGQK